MHGNIMVFRETYIIAIIKRRWGGRVGRTNKEELIILGTGDFSTIFFQSDTTLLSCRHKYLRSLLLWLLRRWFFETLSK